jgi:hypothetical protein
MMNIFQYCKTDILISWAQQLSSQAKAKNDEFLLTRARMMLEAAEKKAEAEKDASTLLSLRHMLADQYSAASLYGLASKYYGMLLLTATDPNEKEQLTARLLDVDLRSGQAESARQLLANILLSSDIKPNTEISNVINNYFSQNQDAPAAKQIFLAFAAVKITSKNPRPLWSAQLANWQKLLKITSGASSESNIPSDQNY